MCIFFFFCKKQQQQKPFQVVSPVFHVVLSSRLAEMRKLTALWRAGAEAACKSLEQQRPDPACNETKQSWEGNSACKPPQTKNQAASCPPVMLHLPLQWPAFFTLVGAT